MATSPDTQPSLLIRIRDERDEQSWSVFVELYAPPVYGFLRQRGLQDADAADLTQEVMANVAQAIKSFDYQSDGAAFRSWLFTVVQNRLRNFWRSASRRPIGSGDTQALQQLQDDAREQDAVADRWEREYETRLFHYAADQVRPNFRSSTWQAFWRTAVQARPTKQVAQELNMSTAAVRLAKARVIARIKEQVRLLEEECT